MLCFSAAEPKLALPSPSFLKSNTQTSGIPKGSVFINPYIKAEHDKQAILEKHVKMVDTKDNIRVINGKKICWNYRKGKCRFGHNCIYAHDSDLQKSAEQLEAENRVQRTVLCQNKDLPQPTPQELKQFQSEAALNHQKRKRPGLTQGLIPGKKVMKEYLKHKK